MVSERIYIDLRLKISKKEKKKKLQTPLVFKLKRGKLQISHALSYNRTNAIKFKGLCAFDSKPQSL